MAELREAHLRYLLAIYELGRTQPDVGTLDIANALGYTKASVTKMAGTLMDMGLLVREKYGKIYLTGAKDNGSLFDIEELFSKPVLTYLCLKRGGQSASKEHMMGHRFRERFCYTIIATM